LAFSFSEGERGEGREMRGALSTSSPRKRTGREKDSEAKRFRLIQGENERSVLIYPEGEEERNK